MWDLLLKWGCDPSLLRVIQICTVARLIRFVCMVVALERVFWIGKGLNGSPRFMVIFLGRGLLGRGGSTEASCAEARPRVKVVRHVGGFSQPMVDMIMTQVIGYAGPVRR